jgi:hypothetical protein
VFSLDSPAVPSQENAIDNVLAVAKPLGYLETTSLVKDDSSLNRPAAERIELQKSVSELAIGIHVFG